MDLPAKYGEPSFKKKKNDPPFKKNLFAKSLKSAKWTCLPNMVSLAKKMTQPKIFFSKSLRLATWTCLPNMVSLAQGEKII